MTSKDTHAPLQLLVVEDEALLAEEIQDRLERKGYRVIGIADTGAKAIEVARRIPVDLILMDIRLKGEMDGIEAARQIYEQLGTPVIFLTAHSDQATVERALGPAQFGYVVKPIREQELLAAIEMAVHRHAIECRIAESQLSHEAIFDAAPDAMSALDREGRIQSWNPAAERLFGYRADEMLGRSNAILIAPGHQSQSAALMERVWSGSRIHLQDVVRRRKDGSLVEVALSISPVIGRRDSIVGAVEISRDVSERRKLEEDLRQAQKMQALGLLAGGVAHDFNNLLTVINGYAAMLEKMLSNQPEAQNRASQISKAGQTAAGITEKLLAFSQKRVTKSGILDLNSVIDGFRAIVQQLCGAAVSVTFDLDSSAVPILGTEAGVQTVLLNLVANARDAMPEGGRLTIRTSAIRISAPHESAGEPRLYSVLTVQDSGHGIPAEARDKIFDPFFTTKDTGKGAGLGLATVYGIVKQRGGWIHVDSEPDKGSSFEVYWPAAAGATAAPVREAAREASAEISGTCLLVEDWPAVRDLCARYLRSNGFTVLTASNGAEAIEIGRNYRGRIDLLVSDIVMPQMSGIELAARLEVDRPELAVLLITGYAPEVSNVKPGLVVLAKPFSEDQLLAAGKLVLAQKRERAATAAGTHRELD